MHPLLKRPNRPFEAIWEEKIRLLGFYASPFPSAAGEILELRFFWQGNQTMETDYTVFVHLLDEENNLIAQHDGPPSSGERPTSKWREDEVVVDAHWLKIPQNISQDQPYLLCIGFYELATMERLSVYEDNGIIQNDKYCIDIPANARYDLKLKGDQ